MNEAISLCNLHNIPVEKLATYLSFPNHNLIYDFNSNKWAYKDGDTWHPTKNFATFFYNKIFEEGNSLFTVW